MGGGWWMIRMDWLNKLEGGVANIIENRKDR